MSQADQHVPQQSSSGRQQDRLIQNSNNADNRRSTSRNNNLSSNQLQRGINRQRDQTNQAGRSQFTSTSNSRRTDNASTDQPNSSTVLNRNNLNSPSVAQTGYNLRADNQHPHRIQTTSQQTTPFVTPYQTRSVSLASRSNRSSPPSLDSTSPSSSSMSVSSYGPVTRSSSSNRSARGSSPPDKYN